MDNISRMAEPVEIKAHIYSIYTAVIQSWVVKLFQNFEVLRDFTAKHQDKHQPQHACTILRFSSWAEIRMRYFFRPKRCAPSRAWVVCPPSLWRLWTSEESGKKFMVFWWIWREPQGGFRAPKTSPHLTILRFLVDWIDLGGDLRTGQWNGP